MTSEPSRSGAAGEEDQRAVLSHVRDLLAGLCRQQDPLLEGQYRFLVERVEALLAVTET